MTTEDKEALKDTEALGRFAKNRYINYLLHFALLIHTVTDLLYSCYYAIVVVLMINSKWTAEEDHSLKEVVKSYRMGDIIPWSYGKLFLLLIFKRLSTVGNQTFPVTAAHIWNSLSQHVTSAPSVSVFQVASRLSSSDIPSHDFLLQHCNFL